MKRISIALIVLLVAASALAAGPGQGPGRGPGQGPNPGPQQDRGEILPPPLLAEFLALTEAQVAGIQALRETLRTKVDPLRQEQRANQEELRAAVEAGNAAAAGQLVIENHAIGQQIRAAHDAFLASFEAMLTPDQKAKWDVYQEIVELRREPRD